MIQLTERLKEVSDGIIDVWYTDYVGDVCNLIMNKPRVYRIIYYKPQDIWCISIAYEYIHCDLLDLLQDNGIIDVRQDGYKNAWEAYQDEDASYCFKFVPNGMEKESGADWDKIIRLTTGQLQMSYNVRMWQDDYRLNRVGCHGPEFAEEFMDKLESMGAFDFDDPDEYYDYDDDEELEESVRLLEGAKEITGGIWYSDYAGDIANFILNKPKPYRVIYIYDDMNDIWIIADSYQYTHVDMLCVAYENDIIQFDYDKYDDIYDWIEDMDSYRMEGDCRFIPDGDRYKKEFDDAYYPFPIKIETGYMMLRDIDDLGGVFSDLLKVFVQRKAISNDELNKIDYDYDFSAPQQESLICYKLSERLEEIDADVFCTDYVGDIANWLVNKPKVYRFIYYAPSDIWCIADAIRYTHDEILGILQECGCVDVKADGYDDVMDAYYSGDCIRFTFAPNGQENEINWRYMKNATKLSSGIIVPDYKDSMTYGGGLELYNKLKSMSAVDNT